jgi:hypothetical protein
VTSLYVSLRLSLLGVGLADFSSCNLECSLCRIGSRGGKFHQKVLEVICLLGKMSGLYTLNEWTRPSFSGGVEPVKDQYTPLIDIVWFIDLVEILGRDAFDRLSSVISEWTSQRIPHDILRFIPYAAFEVEVSDPTSKTIYSDLLNLAATRCQIKIEVIREIGDMNVERANRIKESAVRLCGATDIHILTPNAFDNLLTAKPSSTTCSITRRKTRKLSYLQNQLVSLANWLNLDGEVEFIPPECLSQGIYVPRLDAAWLIKVPNGASGLMSALLEKHKIKATGDLCHLTLFGFEYEKATAHKHIAGSVANLSRHSYIGFLVTPKERVEQAKRIVNRYSYAFGFNNVFVLNEEDISKALMNRN